MLTMVLLFKSFPPNSPLSQTAEATDVQVHTHQPVSGHVACQVRADIDDGASLIEVGQVLVASNSRRLRSKKNIISTRDNFSELRTYHEECPYRRVDGCSPSVREDGVIRVRQARVLD